MLRINVYCLSGIGLKDKNDRLPGRRTADDEFFGIPCTVVFSTRSPHKLPLRRVLIPYSPGVVVHLVYYYQSIVTRVKKKKRKKIINTTQHTQRARNSLCSVRSRPTNSTNGGRRAAGRARRLGVPPSRTDGASVSPTQSAPHNTWSLSRSRYVV